MYRFHWPHAFTREAKIAHALKTNSKRGKGREDVKPMGNQRFFVTALLILRFECPSRISDENDRFAAI